MTRRHPKRKPWPDILRLALSPDLSHRKDALDEARCHLIDFLEGNGIPCPGGEVWKAVDKVKTEKPDLLNDRQITIAFGAIAVRNAMKYSGADFSPLEVALHVSHIAEVCTGRALPLPSPAVTPLPPPSDDSPPPSETGESSRPAPNPYRGLASFRRIDRGIFFGRDKLIAKLWASFCSLYDKPNGVRILSILGASGSGKSSIARAGLLAELEKQPPPGYSRVRVVEMTPTATPLLEIGQAFARQAASEPLSITRGKEFTTAIASAADGLRTVCAALSLEKNEAIILLIDQFEEIFSECEEDQEAERNRFVANILDAAKDPSKRLSVVLTMRPEVPLYGELGRVIAEQHELITEMTSDELRAAIQKPAEQSHRPLEDALVDSLLHDTEGREGALPLLQFALTRIWQRLSEGKKPGEILCEIGRVGGALGERAEAIYNSLSKDQQAITRRVFLSTIHLGDSPAFDARRRLRIRDLIGLAETREQLSAVLRRFSESSSRILTVLPAGKPTWSLDQGTDANNQLLLREENAVEVTHEAVFRHWPRLEGWIVGARKHRILRRSLASVAEDWESDDRPDSSLWRAATLDRLRAYVADIGIGDLTRVEREFYEASNARRKRQWAGRAVGVIATLLALVASSLVYVDRRATAADRLAELGRQELLNNQPERAAVYLSAAYSKSPSEPAVRFLLADAMRAVDSKTLTIESQKDDALTFSPDGDRLVTRSATGRIRIWNVADGKLIRELAAPAVAADVQYSSDGRILLSTGYDRIAQLWDATTGALRRSFGDCGPRSEVGKRFPCVAALAPDGAYVAIARDNHPADLLETDRGAVVASLRDLPGTARHIAFNVDGSRVLTIQGESAVGIWDVHSGKSIFRLPDGQARVHAATMRRDGEYLLVTSGEPFGSEVSEWRLSSGELVLKLPAARYRTGLAGYSPDGSRIFTQEGGEIKLWRGMHEPPLVLSGPEAASITMGGRINDVARFSSDGQRFIRIAVRDDAMAADVWDAVTGEVALTLGHGRFSSETPISPDGRYAAIGNNPIAIWNVASTRMRGLYSLANRGEVYLVNEDRSLVLGDGKIRLFNTDLDTPIMTFSLGLNWVPCATDGRQVLAFVPKDLALDKLDMNSEWRVLVWNSADGRLLGDTHVHGVVGGFPRVALKDKFLAVAQGDGVKVVNWPDGKVLASLNVGSPVLGRQPFSKDGRQLMFVSDSRVFIWNWTDGSSPVVTWKGIGRVRAVNLGDARFSPDDREVLTVASGEAKIWSSHGELLHTLDGVGIIAGAWFIPPNGDLLLTMGFNDKATIWDRATGKVLAQWKVHAQAPSYDAVFSPDGSNLVSASGSNAKAWSIRLESRPPQVVADIVRQKVPWALSGTDLRPQ